MGRWGDRAPNRPARPGGWLREAWRRAFASFLTVPTVVVAGFLLLAAGTYALDRARFGWLAPVRGWMEGRVFGSTEATSALLGTVAGGTITITSITFSLLLLALQQSAGTMTHAVFDQFLRRRANQVYAGWFVGLTLYALVTLATVSPPFNPVFGATLALALAIAALYVLLLLVYATIAQMRPEAVIEAIHGHTLRARERQQDLLRRTRRPPAGIGGSRRLVRADTDGFVAEVDLVALEAALARVEHPAEVALLVPVGTYRAYHDPLVEVTAPDAGSAAALAEAAGAAVRLAPQRDLDRDPAYGIEQLATIAWTTVSTSKQNPAPGLLVAQHLRDLLARWAEAEGGEGREGGAGGAGRPDRNLTVVYPDALMDHLFGALESLAVVASESMQHQVYAEVLRGLAVTLDRLPTPLQEQADGVVLRSLAGLGDHLLTADLDAALGDVAAALDGANRPETAAAVRAARGQLAATVGHLNSRSTRVPSG